MKEKRILFKTCIERASLNTGQRCLLQEGKKVRVKGSPLSRGRPPTKKKKGLGSTWEMTSLQETTPPEGIGGEKKAGWLPPLSCSVSLSCPYVHPPLSHLHGPPRRPAPHPRVWGWISLPCDRPPLVVARRVQPRGARGARSARLRRSSETVKFGSLRRHVEGELPSPGSKNIPAHSRGVLSCQHLIRTISRRERPRRCEAPGPAAI